MEETTWERIMTRRHRHVNEVRKPSSVHAVEEKEKEKAARNKNNADHSPFMLAYQNTRDCQYKTYYQLL